MSLRYGSTFSGIGGLDRGLHRAGLDLSFACEWEPWRRGILRRHWPGLAIVDDVRLVTGDYLRKMEEDGRDGAGGVRRQEPGDERGGVPHALGRDEERLRGTDRLTDIHLLVGGFPCQDLSVAGRRRGFEGERSSLFFEFARAADDLVPAGGFVLIENVPGLFSSNDGRDFSVLRATLASLGFHDLAWRTLDSRHFGVPQRRRRVFILARRACGGVCAEVLLELSGRRRDTSQGRAARARAAEATGAGAAPAGGSSPRGAGEAERGGARAGAAGGRGDSGRGGRVAVPLTSGGNHPSKPGRRLEDDHNIVAGTITNRYGASSGQDIDSGNRVVTGDGAGDEPVLEVANTLKGQRGKGGGGIGPEETLLPQAQVFDWQGNEKNRTRPSEDHAPALGTSTTPAVHQPQATVDEVGSLQASQKGYRNDADSAGGGMYAVTGDAALGQAEAGSLGRMGDTGGHRLDLDGHGAYVASREDPTALDTRMGHGPDDNRAQAGHLVTNEQEVSKALSAHDRFDPSVGTFVTEASGRDESPAITSRAAKGTPDSDVTDALVTHSLTSTGHDASEDGTGRGTPLVAGALTGGQGPQRLDDQAVDGSHVVALSSGEAREVDVAPTVAGGNASTGRNAGRSATQFTAVVGSRDDDDHPPQTVSNDSSPVTKTDEVGALKVGTGLGIPSAPAVYTKKHGASSPEDGENWDESDTSRTLTSMNMPGDLAAARSLVRRLTPSECERLQGLPDGWTLMMGEGDLSDEELSALREALGAQGTRAEARLRGAEVLRPGLLARMAECDGDDFIGGPRRKGPQGGATGVLGRAMRAVWYRGWAPLPTPRGWRPAEQQSREYNDPVSWLSYLRRVGEGDAEEQRQGPVERPHPADASYASNVIALPWRGPSLADAPSWYELGQPAPVNHRTFNALPDQRRRDSGEMKGAVELRETDRSLTLDTSGRDPSAFNGGMMVVPEAEAKAVTENDEMVYESDQAGSLTSGGGKPGQGYPMVHCFHSDAERAGEAKADSPDAEGRMRKRDPGVGIAEGESYSLTTGKPHAIGYSVSGGGGDDADLRAEETESAETLTTRGAWAGTQGGTLVDQQADHLDSIEGEVREEVEQPRGEAGTVRSHMRPGSNSDDVVLGFKTDGDERSSVSAGDTAPTMRGAEAGTTAVALGGPPAVAEGRACPFDCPPDGPRYASLGDAVTSPVAQWIGERLVDVLREKGVVGPDGEVDLTADLRDA